MITYLFLDVKVGYNNAYDIAEERRLAMKYFVTGATGFVGGVLAKKLREQNHEVHASVRNPEKASQIPATFQPGSS